MATLEFITEVVFKIIFEAFFEVFPKITGILLKWIFYLGQKSISEIKMEKNNSRLGFLFLLITLIMFIFYTIKL